jgi:hypothetical protein
LPWEFKRDHEVVRVDPTGRLLVGVKGIDSAVSAAIAGIGIVTRLEEWLRPHPDSKALEPFLEGW